MQRPTSVGPWLRMISVRVVARLVVGFLAWGLGVVLGLWLFG
jgi:hypothetical protein